MCLLHFNATIANYIYSILYRSAVELALLTMFRLANLMLIQLDVNDYGLIEVFYLLQDLLAMPVRLVTGLLQSYLFLLNLIVHMLQRAGK